MNNSNPIKLTPTVVPVDPFDAKADAEALMKAMKGLGTDEKAIIEVLARRTNDQRLQIEQTFKSLYAKDLQPELKSELSGRFRDVIISLMLPLPHFYAKELHDAMKGMITDDEAIIEIMCSLSNLGIRTVAITYEKLYGKSLVETLKGCTSGQFQALLSTLCEANRDENVTVDDEAAKNDAKKLWNSNGQPKGTNDTYISVLLSRSYPHLRQLFQQFHDMSNSSIEDSIKKEYSGCVQKALLAIVQCAKSKVDFFVERLHASMAGLGTSDKTLIRIVVSRSGIDLGDIKTAFQAKYGKSLQSWISGDTSGDYKQALLALVG